MTSVSASELAHTEAFRAENLRILESIFISTATSAAPASEDPFQIRESVEIWAKPVRDVYTPIQNAALFSAISRLFHAIALEEACLATGLMPTREEYAYRLDGSGVEACLRLLGYAYGLELPQEVLESDAMRRVGRGAANVAWLINDLLSFYKELSAAAAPNLVAIYLSLHLSGKAQSAIDAVVTELREAVDDFERAAEEAVRGAGGYEEEVRKYVKACKQWCMGSLCWSYQTDRYRLRQFRNSEGGFTMAL